jgi:glycine dehydrogenase
VKTRACPFGIKVDVVDLKNFEFNKDIGGVLFQYPDTEGTINNFSEICANAK